MNSFTQGLKDKIELLRDEREELEDSMSRIDTKIETLEELLSEEEGSTTATPAVKPKRKRGRPKGSKKTAATPNTELYDEAVATLPGEGTTPEMQERLVKRYKPTPRVAEGLGPGIKTGTRDKETKANKTISIEDDE